MNDYERNTKIIRQLCYQIIDMIAFCDRMMALTSCNDCARNNSCEVAPAPGEVVRYNCHLWEGDNEFKEAEEVRHGKWVNVAKTDMYNKEGVKSWGIVYQCNRCGFIVNAVEGHIGQYNYCPHCGAKMEVEE